MATIKQKQALEKIVENRGNIGKAMILAGYDETTARNPKNLTDSKGYRELLVECGLTEQLITTALVEDIKIKEGKRTAELSLGAEILGMKKTGFVIANQINFNSNKNPAEQSEENREILEEVAYIYQEYLRAKLSNKTELTILIPFVKDKF